MREVRTSIVTLVLVAGATTDVLAQAPADQPPPQPPAPQQPAPAPPPPQSPSPYEAPSQAAPPLPEETPAKPKPEEPALEFEVYGFTMLDSGYDFGQIGNPNWQDVMRPTKLPAFEDQFGTGDRTFWGVRQTRFGVQSTLKTDVGDIYSRFEWELFGVGVDEGQTTFRLRHAYGDWKQLRAGQTWSPFMDIDVFPNSIEYWGPNGMVFFRNVQLAWMPIQGDSRVTFALERPGASADTTNYADRIDFTGVVGRFPMPDISGEGRLAFGWGYVELAGIVRLIKWDVLDPAVPVVDGSVWGWGVSASSNIKLGPALLKLQAVGGKAIQNYMNDASDDIGPVPVAGGLIDGEGLESVGLVAFVDWEWSKLFTSSAGWSYAWLDNSEGQAPDAFHSGQYALANLLFHPTDKLMIGGEFQFGRRTNNSDGFDVNDFKFQLSVKFSYAKLFGGD